MVLSLLISLTFSIVGSDTVSTWLLLSGFLGLIFGKKSEDDVDVSFVAPPSEPPEIEDEFADLEAELDTLE